MKLTGALHLLPSRPDPELVTVLPDDNAIQQAAESVAARHFFHQSPEWIEFALDRVDGPLLAAIMRGEGWREMAPMRAEYIEWLVDIYHDEGRGAQALYNEMRRELA